KNWGEVTVTFRMRTRNLEASQSPDFSGAKVGLDWLRQEGGRPFSYVGSSPPIKGDKDWSWERVSIARKYVPDAGSLRIYPILYSAAGTAEFDDIRVVVTEQP